MTLKRVTEALVFASPKPISTKEIVAALRAAAETNGEDAIAQDFAKAKDGDVVAVLAELQTELMASSRAFQLAERANGWTFVSEPACAPWVRQLYPEAKPTRLTGPQLETLAIIAYRQPVTRADIEAVRGVAVDGVMQVLLDRGLVKIAGRAEVPGRPLLYTTTAYFLEHFGLRTTDELPNASELRRVALPVAKVPEETPPAAPVLEARPASSDSPGILDETFPPEMTEAATPEPPTTAAAEPPAGPPTPPIEPAPTSAIASEPPAAQERAKTPEQPGAKI